MATQGVGLPNQHPVDCDKEEARVLAAWPEAYSWAMGKVTGFLKSHEHLLNKCPPVDSPKVNRAWPSHRTWDYATRALAGSRIHGLTEEQRDQLIAGFVGSEAAESFLTYLENDDLPSASDFLDGKTPFKHNPARADKTTVVLSACVALVCDKNCPQRQARTAAFWKFIDSIRTSDKVAKDLIVPACMSLVKAGLHTAKEALPVLSALTSVLEAAGFQGKK
jgi:hypothetical protein